MTIEEITSASAQLNEELRQALSTMERSDKVMRIRKEIRALQAQCPHSDKYQFGLETICSYCGYKRGE